MKEWCLNCKHFILKLMLNGYDGICEEHGCFTKANYKCEKFCYGKNEIYKKEEKQKR